MASSSPSPMTPSAMCMTVVHAVCLLGVGVGLGLRLGLRLGLG